MGGHWTMKCHICKKDLDEVTKTLNSISKLKIVICHKCSKEIIYLVIAKCLAEQKKEINK